MIEGRAGTTLSPHDVEPTKRDGPRATRSRSSRRPRESRLRIVGAVGSGQGRPSEAIQDSRRARPPRRDPPLKKHNWRKARGQSHETEKIVR